MYFLIVNNNDSGVAWLILQVEHPHWVSAPSQAVLMLRAALNNCNMWQLLKNMKRSHKQGKLRCGTSQAVMLYSKFRWTAMGYCDLITSNGHCMGILVFGIRHPLPMLHHLPYETTQNKLLAGFTQIGKAGTRRLAHISEGNKDSAKSAPRN